EDAPWRHQVPNEPADIVDSIPKRIIRQRFHRVGVIGFVDLSRMTKRVQSLKGLLLAAAIVSSLRGAEPSEGITWNASQGLVGADIDSWPLPKVLEAITASTGWQIYVEPDTRFTVSTRFQKLKP